MLYSYDSYGWYSSTLIAGRTTEVAPPEQPWPEGLQPNWTGYAWRLLAYIPPPTPTAPVSVPSRKITPLAFKSRMTVQERVAIRAAAKTDPYVEDFLDLLNSVNDHVDLDRADTQEGLAYLVQAGLLTEERKTAVLSARIKPIEHP